MLTLSFFITENVLCRPYRGKNMTIRENLEEWEVKYLSPYACLSKNSKGRH